MEVEFRKKVQGVLDKIEKAFSDVDPDVAECEQILGAMTITLGDRSKCIVSTQPSIQQIWLALAAKGVAFHFNFDESQGKWLDDKGRGIELIQCIKDYLKEEAGLELAI